MSEQISRRTVAKSAAWATPVLAVTAASPALAASCTPTNASVTSAVTWISHQTSFTSPDGDPEYHVVEYTFTNTGPDPVGTEIPFQIQVAITVFDGEEATLDLQSTSNSTATVTSNDVENGDGTNTYTATVTAHSTAAIPVNGTFSLTVQATYGVLNDPDGNPAETVTVQSPIVSTNTENCVTTTSTTTITGSSDGTSYTS